MRIKFLLDKGQVKAGYVGVYPEGHAQMLISEGVAELVKPAPKTSLTKKLKGEDNVK